MFEIQILQPLAQAIVLILCIDNGISRIGDCKLHHSETTILNSGQGLQKSALPGPLQLHAVVQVSAYTDVSGGMLSVYISSIVAVYAILPGMFCF